MSEHTKEPWETYGYINEGPLDQVGATTGDLDVHVCDCDCHADARRIVACVNACAGIETEVLERAGEGWVKESIINLSLDDLNSFRRADEAERLLPPPDKLEMLADWIDVKYPDDDDPEVQLDLRRWARDIRAFLAGKENPDAD